MIQGYKIDLQHMVGSKMPTPLLKLVYRFSFRRRVMIRLLCLSLLSVLVPSLATPPTMAVFCALNFGYIRGC